MKKRKVVIKGRKGEQIKKRVKEGRGCEAKRQRDEEEGRRRKAREQARKSRK